MSNRRPTLKLKPKPADIAEPAADAVRSEWERIVGGAEIDPHNLHKLVQPSRTPIPDYERLLEVAAALAASAVGGRDMSPSLADTLKMEASSLIAKLGNAASDHAVDRD